MSGIKTLGRGCLYMHAALALAATALTTAVVSPPAVAQQTTSVISGTVMTPTGKTVANATVTVTDTRTNRTRDFVTNAQGRIVARGLRTGGPYTITLRGTADYDAFVQEGIVLELAVTTPVTLVARAQGAIEEIVVTGRQSNSQIQMGTGSVFDAENINQTANTGRDFKNIIRQDPRVIIDPTNSNAFSIAGNNNRFNSLTVDGVRQNDDFGLNNSGFPTLRSPISIEAVEQVDLEVAPFNVEFGAFSGGTVNIVTKSGTNEFHGSAFGQFSGDNLTGNRTGNISVRLGDFKERNFGGTLSGPIVKDHLFFFASYEKFAASDTDGLSFGPAGSGRPNEVSKVSQADIDRVISISKSVYGFDPLALPTNGTSVIDKKFLGKIDWVISDDHTLTASYQYAKGNDLRTQGNSLFSGGGRIGLPSNWYNNTQKLKTYSAQLFSHWTDALSTEVKFALKQQDTDQAPLNGADFAQMDIRTTDGGTIRIGPDFFRHGNRLANDQVQLKFKGDYLWRQHLFTLGYERDILDVFNLFTPGSEGDYDFNSIDDFQARTASNLFFQNAPSGDENDAAANFTFAISSAYVQDRWEPSDSLTVMAGVRVDWYTSNDTPAFNQNFFDRHGFSNQETLDGRSIFMPRLGFNYQVDETTLVRGGAGLFSGGNPNVWISNSFSNDGVSFTRPDNAGSTDPNCADVEDSAAALTNVDGFNIAPEVLACLFPGNGNVNAIDPKFDIPSNWKFNLALEHEFDLGMFGDAWHVVAEAVWSRVQDAVSWFELRRTQISSASDGRPIFDVPGGFDLLLTNTSGGKNDSYSLSVDKKFEDRFGGETYFFGAYTFSDVTDVNPAQSSTATSNFSKPAGSDRNNRAVATSDFEVRHRFNSTLTYSKAFFGNNKSTLSFYLETRSGHHFSYTLDNPGRSTDVFGGDREFTRRDSQLLYVPTGASDPKVTFDASFPVQDFLAFVENSNLKKFKGQIAPRNVGTSPWRTLVNMRFIQELHMPGLPLFGENRFEFFYDIENLGNLLNHKWGQVSQVGFPFNAAVVKASTDANGQLIYETFNLGRATNPERIFNRTSVWKMQAGLRFTF